MSTRSQLVEQAQAWKVRAERAEEECKRLRHELTVGDVVTAPFSDEPADPKVINSLDHVRIYLVWTVGLYPNGNRLLDIRGVTFSLGHAKTWSKILRRDKQPGEFWTRVIIEPRVANHLYGEKLREMLVALGRL